MTTEGGQSSWSGRGRPRTRALLSLLVFVFVVAPDASVTAQTSRDTYRGRHVADVLRELQLDGLELIFSSAVVDEGLRVLVEPKATDSRALVDEILRPHGLAVTPGPGTALLVVKLASLPGSLRGRVVSSVRRRPVTGARVRIDEAGLESRSDSDGRFEIARVPAGRWSVTVEATGFQPLTWGGVRVEPDTETQMTVELLGSPRFVTEIVVTPGRHALLRQPQDDRLRMTDEQRELTPAIGGDVGRLVELLPGVTAADNSAALNVRGSAPADVSVMLDGLELYDPYHFQGFQSPFSLIDSRAVERIELLTGGFTAEFGDRHGGFLDLSTVTADDTRRAELELGTVNSRFSFLAPLSKRPGHWLVTGRSWYPQALWNTVDFAGGGHVDPRFGDLYFKAALRKSDRHLLSLHGLVAYDRLEHGETDETDETVNERANALTRSGYLWVRAVSVWSPALTTETTVSAGRIDKQRNGVADSGSMPIAIQDRRIVEALGCRSDAAWQVSPSNLLKAGVELRRLESDYEYINLDLSQTMQPPLRSISLNPHGTSLSAWAAHRAALTPKLAIEVGLRWDEQSYTQDNQLSPRFNALWIPDARSTVRLAVGRYQQSQRIYELRVEDGETAFSRAEVSEQAGITYERRMASGLRLRVDGYYRKLSHQWPRYESLFGSVELFPEIEADRVLVSPQRARARGIEASIQGADDKPLVWWASYARSATEDVVDGRDVPRNWDQPHAFKFLVGYRSRDHWSISLIGQGRTGWPTTPATATQVTQPDGTTAYQAVPGERNSERFRAYTRLDLRARRAIPLRRGRLWINVDVVNVTDRRNACCIDDFTFAPQPDGGVDAVRQVDSWRGITPTVSVLWEF